MLFNQLFIIYKALYNKRFQSNNLYFKIWTTLQHVIATIRYGFTTKIHFLTLILMSFKTLVIFCVY